MEKGELIDYLLIRFELAVLFGIYCSSNEAATYTITIKKNHRENSISLYHGTIDNNQTQSIYFPYIRYFWHRLN